MNTPETDIAKPFLPSIDELEKMTNEEFEYWIAKSKNVLKKRAIKRDPLFHLKKQISNILKDNEITEATKETRVLQEIERHYRIISQLQ